MKLFLSLFFPLNLITSVSILDFEPENNCWIVRILEEYIPENHQMFVNFLPTEL